MFITPRKSGEFDISNREKSEEQWNARVVFAEEENAHSEEQTEAIEFPDTTDEVQTDGA